MGNGFSKEMKYLDVDWGSEKLLGLLGQGGFAEDDLHWRNYAQIE